MLFELMQSSDITSLNATLQTIFDEFVKSSVSSVDVEIKITALKTIGMYELYNTVVWHSRSLECYLNPNDVDF